MADVDARTEAPKLIKFHVLQGLNYVFACAYFAYLAVQGSEAQPKFASRLWMSLEDPPLNPLERSLLAMFWMSPFCIGLGYIFLSKHLESVYGSFLTAFMGGSLSFRVAFTPAQYLTLIIIPVDFGGLLYKLFLFREEFWAIPKKARRLLWNVPQLEKRSTLTKHLEAQAYFFAVYMYALSFVSTDLLLPGYQGPRVPAFSKIFFVTQAVIFVFAIPGLRQGKKAASKIMSVNRYIVSYFLIKGIYFDHCIPSQMSVWVLLPYMTTLVVEMHLYLWKSIMKYSIFRRYITRRQASSAKFFTMLFAVSITTVSNLWYICTGFGLASISKRFGGFFDQLAFLPGRDAEAARVRYVDVMGAGMLFLFAIALEEVLDKKNTAKVVSVIHFGLTLAISVQSFMTKVLCNLETSSQWTSGRVTSKVDTMAGIHCIFWVTNIVLRAVVPLSCLYILQNMGGPISAWIVSMKSSEKDKRKSHLASVILLQHSVRTAIKRTMIFHGMGVLFFATLANTVFTTGLPTFFPRAGGAYLVSPLIERDFDAQFNLFYTGLVISLITIIMGFALTSVNGRALPLAQGVSFLWVMSIWTYLCDSWMCIAHQRGSHLQQYLKPLFSRTVLMNSNYLPSVAIFGIGSALLSLVIISYVKVTKMSVYNRKVQSPNDFAENLSCYHKHSYIFHGCVLTLLSSSWMLYACTHNDVSLVSKIFETYLFEDVITCVMMMHFGFIVYECREALHHRTFLSCVNSLHFSWIASGYILLIAAKLVALLGYSSMKMELIQVVSYLVYNVIIQFQATRAVFQALFLIQPTFNSNLPAILKSYNALSRSKYSEEMDIGLMNTKIERRAVLKRLSKGDPNWKNNWERCFISAFGEDELSINKRTNFPIPMRADEDGLKKYKRKARLGTSLAGLLGKVRPAHPAGVGAHGIFEVIENDKIPETSFFVPGRQFHLRCRHSNAVGFRTPDGKKFDDATLDVRGLAIKFGHGRDGGELDLHLNTGAYSDFFNLPTFFEFATNKTKHNREKHQDYVRRHPTVAMAAIDGQRRAPDSYTQLLYYSQTCRHFWGLDGKKRYCKFRVVPFGDGLFSKVDPEPFKPDMEDQQRICSSYLTDNERLHGEKREPDYLRKEFKARVERDVVKYRFQIQLHEAGSQDTQEVFNPHKDWDTPFLDLGVITLIAPMADYETENTSFDVQNTPECLSIIQPLGPLDYNSLNWMRAIVYTDAARARRCFSLSKGVLFTNPCKYILNFHTSHVQFSGIHGNVYITLVGTKAATTQLYLENSGYDFKADTVSRFVTYNEDIGDPLYCFIHHDSQESWKGRLWKLDVFTGSNWNCGKVQVIIKSPIYGKKVRTFYVWKWLSKGELAFAIADHIPSDPKAQAVSKQLFKKYFEDKQQSYRWTSGDYLPNHLTYEHHSDLPDEEQFSVPKHKDFLAISMEGLLSQKLVKTFFMDKGFKRLDNYLSLYVTQKPVNHTQCWQDDEELGRQLMNGVHPLWFRKCNRIPEKLHVDDEILTGLLPPGRSLVQEIEAGHIFILDYEILEGIPTAPGAYVATPIALLYASEESSLRPIAVQLHQSGGPVWTPKDNRMEWLLVKMHLVSADSNCHQMVSHLFGTHLLMEPFAVAIERNLFSAHPVYKLLKPHFMYTIAINTIGRSTLIQPGGIVDKVLAVGCGGHIELLAKAYSRFKLEDLNIPLTLEKRGVLDKKVLKNYFWRDDALLMWNAIKKYTLAVLRVHYKEDSDIKKDEQIQSFIREMRYKGFENKDPNHHGIPHTVTSIDQMADICTSLLYCTSCQHAAVNFAMYDFYSFIPNRSLCLRKPPPTKKGEEVSEEDICDALPRLEQSALTIGIIYALSTFSSEEVFIGNYKVDTMDFPDEGTARRQFQRDLAEIESQIKERNSKLGVFGYKYLLPSQTPSNIAI